MAGFIGGGLLSICALIDRHIGNTMTADIETCTATLCFVIQFGANAIVEAVRK